MNRVVETKAGKEWKLDDRRARQVPVTHPALQQSRGIMVQQAIRLCVFLGGLFVAACGVADGDTIRVTIDMRCGSSADCPARFSCEADTEHGPPTTMCESIDPQASCPAGFDTKVGHGQTFCTPRAGVSARPRSSSIMVRE